MEQQSRSDLIAVLQVVPSFERCYIERKKPRIDWDISQKYDIASDYRGSRKNTRESEGDNAMDDSVTNEDASMNRNNRVAS